MTATVVAVHASPSHTFSKATVSDIELIEGFGVRGDAHAGVTVKHRHRVRRQPSAPNLRQVHLIHRELFDDLARVDHHVAPGELGENITTKGLDLLGLPEGARLHIGDAVIVVTGLRNPCQQINDFQPGLMKQLIRKDDSGNLERLAGVMGVVAHGGRVRPGDAITVELPAGQHVPLAPV